MSTNNLFVKTYSPSGLGYLNITDADTNALVAQLIPGGFHSVLDYSVTPNGNYVALSEANFLYIYNAPTYTLAHTLNMATMFPGLSVTSMDWVQTSNNRVYITGISATHIYVGIYNIGSNTVATPITVAAFPTTPRYLDWAGISTRTFDGRYFYFQYYNYPTPVSTTTLCIDDTTQSIVSTSPSAAFPQFSSIDSSRLYGSFNSSIAVFSAGSTTHTEHAYAPGGTAPILLTSSNDDSAVYVINYVGGVYAIRTYSTVTWTALNAIPTGGTSVYAATGAPPNGNLPNAFVMASTGVLNAGLVLSNTGVVLHTFPLLTTPSNVVLSRSGNTITTAALSSGDGFGIQNTTTFATVFYGASGLTDRRQFYTELAQSTQAGAVVAASFTGTAVGTWTNGTATLTTTYTATAVATVTSRLTNSIVMIV